MEDSSFEEEEQDVYKEGMGDQLRTKSQVAHKGSDENTSVLMDYIYFKVIQKREILSVAWNNDIPRMF